MEFVENAVGRLIPVEIEGRKLKPFAGAFADNGGGRKASPLIPVTKPGQEKLCSIKESIEKSGLKDGMTISFHHHLRDGDYVVNMTVDEIARIGIKDLTLAPSALFPCHKPLIEHIKNGVITKIEGSMNGPVGEYVSYGGLPKLAVLRTHGGRARAIEDGDLHIDVAFLAASSADDYGNANGVDGISAFGPMAYGYADAMYADKVVIVTDDLVPYPCAPCTIAATHVDYVVVVDKIGDPERIVSGTTRITRSPTRLLIAKYAAQFIQESGYLKDGFSFQTGAGGISLAVTKILGEIMIEEGIKGSFINGGLSSYAVELYKKGLFHVLYDGQVFDRGVIESFRNDVKHIETPMTMYANYHSKGCLVNRLDVGFLGATEVDVDFNVNVNTHSDGLLLHGIGGHPDVAAGCKLSLITIPSYRKRIPVVREKVTTVTAPGETIDAIVTERGIAINPRRVDLIDRLKKSDLPIVTIEKLKDRVEKITGKPEPPRLKDRVIALIEYRDGTIIDVVREVEK
ncbi:MAG: citrate lyase subunit alpha [Candidatus Cloacimonadota bacterium]|nr:MAG: citrate lyase subunit alpha [Candidatus Cloacimonadota bacterium]